MQVSLNGNKLSQVKIALDGVDITSDFKEADDVATATIKDGVYVGDNRVTTSDGGLETVTSSFSYAPPMSIGLSAPQPPGSAPIQTQVQTTNSSGEQTNGVEVGETIYANPGPPTDWQLLLLSRSNLSMIANKHYTITPNQESNTGPLLQLISDLQPGGALINQCGLAGCLVVLQGPVNNASFSPYPCGSLTEPDLVECSALQGALISIGATATAAYITSGSPSGAGYSFIGNVGHTILSAGVNFERVTCSNPEGCVTLPVPAPVESNTAFMNGVAPNGVDGVVPSLVGTADSGTTSTPATPYSPAMTIYDNGAMGGLLVPDNNNNYTFTWAATRIRFQLGTPQNDPDKNLMILQIPAGSTMTFPGGQTTLQEESAALPAGQVGGFHVVVLNATTFKTLANATYVDNVTLCKGSCQSPDGTTLYPIDQLPAALKQFNSRGNLWFVGSIGNLSHDYQFSGPGLKDIHGQDIWDRVAQSIQDLGGTYALFDMLDDPALAGDDYGQYVKDRVPTDDDYNMVGQLWINASGVANPYAVEASRAISRQTTLYPVAGNMQGVLEKGHDGFYRATAHSQYAGVMPEPALSFENASYLHRIPWPLTGPGDPAGPNNAYQWISEQLLQCVSGCGDIRFAYTNTNETPSLWYSVLSDLQPPADCTGTNNPCGFTDDDFATAKTQVLQELEDLTALRALQNNMVTTALAQEPDFNSVLTAVADNVLAGIPYTTTIHIGANTTDDMLNVVGDIGGFAGLIPEVGSGVSAGINTGIGLYELFSDDGTTANDPNGVSLKEQEQDFAAIADLANKRANQYAGFMTSIGATFNRIVSDWGRMQTAAAPVINNTLQFSIQGLGQYLAGFNLALRRSLYSTLMPLNFYAVHYRYADPGLTYYAAGLRPGWYAEELGEGNSGNPKCFAWQTLPSLLANNPQSFGFWVGALIDGPGASVTFSVSGNGNGYPFDAWWDLWFVGEKQPYDNILSGEGPLYKYPECPPDNSNLLPPASFFNATELFTPLGTDADALGFYKPWFLGRGTLTRLRAVGNSFIFWSWWGNHGRPDEVGSAWAPDPDNY